MFVAALAFLLQSSLILVSKVEAGAGLMPKPAVTLDHAHHNHDRLAGPIHDHGGFDAQAQVHDQSGSDETSDPTNCVSICSLFAGSMLFATASTLSVSLILAGQIELQPFRGRAGLGPSALIRPPSISSIA
jgi:hypothetical protein